MKRRQFLGLAASTLTLSSPLGVFAAPKRVAHDGAADAYWQRVFARMPASLAALVDDPAHQVQLRCIRIRRTSEGALHLRPLDHGLAPRRWFAAASVVKLPMALLAAERLSAHGLDASAVITLSAPPATGEWPQDEPLAERFGRSLNRTFTVSDNVPYNRWYEFLGADYVNRRLAELGYPDARMISRLGSGDREANLRTGGGVLADRNGIQIEWRDAAIAESRHFPYGAALTGAGWRQDDGTIVAGPHDFSFGNFLPLPDSLRMLQAFLLPESVPAAQRWRIDGTLRAQLLHAMALRPRDSDDPHYPEADHPDGYARWFVVGDNRARYPQSLSVFGKSGQAYGYLSEVAYLVDRARGNEYLLGAVIHANADGIYNDDRYEYEAISQPFLAALGRAVLEVGPD